MTQTQKQNRVAGCALPDEGRIRDASGFLGNAPGSTRCRCGEPSPELRTTADRQRWHRGHKNTVRAARAAASTDNPTRQ